VFSSKITRNWSRIKSGLSSSSEASVCETSSRVDCSSVRASTRCLAQRPDLFEACLPAVGVMDMLRFHKFTIGWVWTSDYGSAGDPEQLKTLLAYSPLHNLKPGTRYPPTLITTADHYDRVVPAYSFKLAAALQAAQAGEAPVLIRVQTKAGHGFGKPTAILIEEFTDSYAFLIWALGVEH